MTFLRFGQQTGHRPEVDLVPGGRGDVGGAAGDGHEVGEAADGQLDAGPAVAARAAAHVNGGGTDMAIYFFCVLLFSSLFPTCSHCTR